MTRFLTLGFIFSSFLVSSLVATTTPFCDLLGCQTSALQAEVAGLSAANTNLNTTLHYCQQSSNQVTCAIQCMKKQLEYRKIQRSVVDALYAASVFDRAFAITFQGAPFPKVNTSHGLIDILDPNMEGRVMQLGFHFNPLKIREYFTFLTASAFYYCENGVCRNTYNFRRFLTRFTYNGTLSSYSNQFEFRATIGDVNPFTNSSYVIDESFGSNITQSGDVLHTCSGNILKVVMNVLQGINATNDLDRTLTINQICGAEAVFCRPNATTRQYNSTAECVAFLSTIKNGTAAYQGVENSLRCRRFHIKLATLDSVTHCPHLGPNQVFGDPCYDYTNQNFYDPLNFLGLLPPGQGYDNQTCNLEMLACDKLIDNMPSCAACAA